MFGICALFKLDTFSLPLLLLLLLPPTPPPTPSMLLDIFSWALLA